MKIETALGATAAIAATALAPTAPAQSSTAGSGASTAGTTTVRAFISGDTSLQDLWDHGLELEDGKPTRQGTTA
ncbi:hypothetical protein [Sinomonas susongensis]|uniref:hypothetical protein n=1 Tax=Sinomonas susongensis TaxID=1324851 RepID=UPI0011089539|nr:hypothetical protein [Sinomonas susongensis]